MTERAFEVVCSAATDRERWLLERERGIGASEAAAVLGVSRWDSPLSIYTKKIGLEEEPERSSILLEWGRWNQRFVLDHFQRETKRNLMEHEEMLRSVTRPWQFATLDAVQYRDDRKDPGILEVKTVTHPANWQDGIPVDVRIQVQHQLAVTGWQWGSIAVLFCCYGVDLRFEDIERDEELIAVINEGEADFWQRVQDQVPPNPDGHRATSEALKRLYPIDNGATIQLPGELIEIDARRVELDSALTELESEKLLIDNRIKAEMGVASVGLLPAAAYHYKADKRGRRSLRRVEVKR